MERFDENTFQTDNSYSEKDIIEEVKEASTSDLETSSSVSEQDSNISVLSDSQIPLQETSSPVSEQDSNISVSSDSQIPQSPQQEEKLEEHSEEIENIPEEQDISQSFTLHCSPTEKEEGFNFDKELPATPCDNNPNEQDLLMNFSTSHFEVEDPVNVPETETPVKLEELDSKLITSTETKVEELVESPKKEDIPEQKEVIPKQQEDIPKQQEDIPKQQEDIPKPQEVIPKQEDIPEQQKDIPEQQEDIPEQQEDIPEQQEDIPEQKEEAPPSPEIAQDVLLTSSPVMEIPVVNTLITPSSSTESPKPDTISPVEPISSTEEPKKTRSVKSSKLIPDMGGRSGLSQLNAHVIELVYWRDSRKSGIVLGSVLAILLSLSVVSVVSVISYASLSVLAITLSFRLYKNILQAVQKTTDGHPFKEYLEVDVTLPSEKIHEIADLSAARLNTGLLELRRLFLVEDLVDSFKFGLALWALTYVGSWFNGITLVILAVVGLFSLPKVYETHQEKIDQNLEVARVKVNEVIEKVQAVLPIGKKPKSQ